jgi:hypothetical protein
LRSRQVRELPPFADRTEARAARQFMRLRRMTRKALELGRFTPELEQERARTVPSFTHFLDLPILFVIIALGALKPETWELSAIGVLFARRAHLLYTAAPPVAALTRQPRVPTFSSPASSPRFRACP